MASSGPLKAILDANGAIGLAKAECLDLLPRLFPRVLMPSMVAREVTDVIAQPALQAALSTWAVVQDPTLDALVHVPMSGGEADRHVIALALQHAPALIISGDLGLVRRAARLGISSASAPDIVRVLAEVGFIGQAKSHLDLMMERGFGIAPEHYDAILRQLGEL